MKLHIKPEFDCVLTINGDFYEHADSVTVSEYDVMYITAFPLAPTQLPFTVKLACSENIKTELACGVKLDSEHYLLSLSPRYPVIYGTAIPQSSPANPISRLFSLIKSGEADNAYAMLTDNLKHAIEKNTLVSFFDGYDRIVECDWENGSTKFYLLDGNGHAHLHTYTVKDGFIDDIAECD